MTEKVFHESITRGPLPTFLEPLWGESREAKAGKALVVGRKVVVRPGRGRTAWRAWKEDRKNVRRRRRRRRACEKDRGGGRKECKKSREVRLARTSYSRVNRYVDVCIVHGCRVAFQGGRWDRNRYMEDRKLGEGRGEGAGLLQGRSIKDARVKRVPFNF